MLAKMCEASIGLAWGMNDGMWKFGCPTPADYVKKLSEYSLDQDQLDLITSHMLVIGHEGEGIFEEGQASKLFNRLKGPKDLMVFTIEEAAEPHCQIGASSISYQKVFDWLDEFLAARA